MQQTKSEQRSWLNKALIAGTLGFVELLLVVATSLGVHVVAYAEPPPSASIQVQVNGRLFNGDPKPFVNEQNRVMVPLRAVLDELGFSEDGVVWDSISHNVTIKQDGQTVRFVIGELDVSVNGFKLRLDSPVQLIGETTFVPVRVLSVLSGFAVEWDEGSRTITIGQGSNSNLQDYGLTGTTGLHEVPFTSEDHAAEVSIRQVSLIGYDSPEAVGIVRQLDLRVPGAPAYLVKLNVLVRNTRKERFDFHWAGSQMLRLVANGKRLVPLASNDEDINRAKNQPELLYWSLGKGEMVIGDNYYAVEEKELSTLFGEMNGESRQLAVAIH